MFYYLFLCFITYFYVLLFIFMFYFLFLCFIIYFYIYFFYFFQEFLPSEGSDSDSSDGEDQFAGAYTSVFESVEKKSKEDSIALYRDLVTNLDTLDHFKEKEKRLLQQSMESDEEEGMESSLSEASEEEEDGSKLDPFERYLEKRKKRQKEYRKAKKEKEMGSKKKKEKDWDVPDDLKNDPFFKEELEIRRKEKLKEEQMERKKKDEEFAKQELEKRQREASAITLRFLII